MMERSIGGHNLTPKTNPRSTDGSTIASRLQHGPSKNERRTPAALACQVDTHVHSPGLGSKTEASRFRASRRDSRPGRAAAQAKPTSSMQSRAAELDHGCLTCRCSQSRDWVASSWIKTRYGGHDSRLPTSVVSPAPPSRVSAVRAGSPRLRLQVSYVGSDRVTQ